jgi:restriction system protein
MMRPLLEQLADKKSYKLSDLLSRIADSLKLSDLDRAQLLPSKRQRTFDNRVAWAKTYLLRAGAVASPMRGYVQITERGLQLLSQVPGQIRNEQLMKFAEFQSFLNVSAEPTDSSPTAKPSPETESMLSPQEELEAAVGRVNAFIRDSLLDHILRSSPDFFERLVVELLLKMGYGGGHENAGRTIGKSHDGGLDGQINLDPLGLETVYLQAKRYAPQNSVSSNTIDAFAGALSKTKSTKGVLLTTSTFTSEARNAANQSKVTIVLIDGKMLSDLLIRYRIGVQSVQTLHVDRIDTEYFEDLNFDGLSE